MTCYLKFMIHNLTQSDYLFMFKVKTIKNEILRGNIFIVLYPYLFQKLFSVNATRQVE